MDRERERAREREKEREREVQDLVPASRGRAGWAGHPNSGVLYRFTSFTRTPPPPWGPPGAIDMVLL